MTTSIFLGMALAWALLFTMAGCVKTDIAGPTCTAKATASGGGGGAGTVEGGGGAGAPGSATGEAGCIGGSVAQE